MNAIELDLMLKCILTFFFKLLKKAIFSKFARIPLKVNYNGKNGIIAAYHVVVDFEEKLQWLAFHNMPSVMVYRYWSRLVMKWLVQTSRQNFYQLGCDKI